MAFEAKTTFERRNEGVQYEYSDKYNEQCGPFFLQYQHPDTPRGNCTYYALNAFFGFKKITEPSVIANIISKYNATVKDNFKNWVETIILNDNKIKFNLSPSSIELYKTIRDVFDYNILAESELSVVELAIILSLKIYIEGNGKKRTVSIDANNFYLINYIKLGDFFDNVNKPVDFDNTYRGLLIKDLACVSPTEKEGHTVAFRRIHPSCSNTNNTKPTPNTIILLDSLKSEQKKLEVDSAPNCMILYRIKDEVQQLPKVNNTTKFYNSYDSYDIKTIKNISDNSTTIDDAIIKLKKILSKVTDEKLKSKIEILIKEKISLQKSIINGGSKKLKKHSKKQSSYRIQKLQTRKLKLKTVNIHLKK
jgi:hypothetical protein